MKYLFFLAQKFVSGKGMFMTFFLLNKTIELLEKANIPICTLNSIKNENETNSKLLFLGISTERNKTIIKIF